MNNPDNTEKDIEAIRKREWDDYKKIDSLQCRLRLAIEFIRSHQYSAEMFCIGCHTYDSDPCKPDCELQKIIGDDKTSNL